jgi:hypothetical protein
MKKITLTIFSLSIFAWAGAQDITSNLEAHFSLDNGAAAVTAGAVTIPGSVTGATPTIDRFGNPNSAMSFDGVDDYIDFGDIANYQFGTSSFTVALWMYGSMDQVGQGVPVGKRGFVSGQDYAYMFGWKSNGELMTYYRDDNGAAAGWPLSTVSAETWTHIAMVFERTLDPQYDSVYVYVNGVKAASQNISTMTGFNATGTSAGQLMAGRSSNGGQHFNGKIDELYIFRRALTEADIFKLMDPTASISEVENHGMINCYPNPTKEKISIISTESTTCTISTANGTVLSTVELNGETATVDVNTYAPGIYFIRTAEGQTVKFIKE